MVCFYHSDRAAVGTCRHCQRGLCVECANPVSDLLACRNRHENDVRLAHQSAERSHVQLQRAGATYRRSALFYGLAGMAFTALGLMQLRYLGLQAAFFVLIGIFLLYAAAANLLEARRYR